MQSASMISACLKYFSLTREHSDNNLLVFGHLFLYAINQSNIVLILAEVLIINKNTRKQK